MTSLIICEVHRSCVVLFCVGVDERGGERGLRDARGQVAGGAHHPVQRRGHHTLHPALPAARVRPPQQGDQVLRTQNHVHTGTPHITPHYTLLSIIALTHAPTTAVLIGKLLLFIASSCLCCRLSLQPCTKMRIWCCRF